MRSIVKYRLKNPFFCGIKKPFSAGEKSPIENDVKSIAPAAANTGGKNQASVYFSR
jgi:hypothetical protein